MDKFKQLLKIDGRSLKWFYESQIRKQTGLSYSGFTAQLNGYAPISADVNKQITSYMTGKK